MSTNELPRLVAAVTRHTPADGLHLTPIPGLALYRASSPTEHHAAVYQPCLCVVAQGAKEVLLGGRAYRYDPAHSLVVSVELPVVSRVVGASSARPCLVVGVLIDPVVVGEFLADGATAPPPGPPERGLGVTPAGPLLDAISRLVALLDAPPDIQPLAPLVLREITYRVLTGPHGSRLRQVAATDALAQRVVRAIRWLKEHFAETFRVESLARQARMSLSGFHHHFKTVTGLSPIQYQKRLRLHEARRLMLGEGIDAAEAGFRVGYESPSQFSREYRRMFGSPPRQDVAVIKGEATAARVS